MYDSRENTRTTLQLIRRHDLPLQVLLGIWLDAELSNHEGCPWIEEPIPAEKLAANAAANREEVPARDRAGQRVSGYRRGRPPSATRRWRLERSPGAVEQGHRLRAAGPGRGAAAVTVANSHSWWRDRGAALAAEVDFLGVHSYPLFEKQTIDTALPFLAKGIDATRAALPDRPLMVLEAGWPTTSSEFPDQANEANQRRHYQELRDWAAANGSTVSSSKPSTSPGKGMRTTRSRPRSISACTTCAVRRRRR